MPLTLHLPRVNPTVLDRKLHFVQLHCVFGREKRCYQPLCRNFLLELHICLVFRHYGRKPDLGGNPFNASQEFLLREQASAQLGGRLERRSLASANFLGNAADLARGGIGAFANPPQSQAPSPSPRYRRNRLLLKASSSPR